MWCFIIFLSCRPSVWLQGSHLRKQILLEQAQAKLFAVTSLQMASCLLLVAMTRRSVPRAQIYLLLSEWIFTGNSTKYVLSSKRRQHMTIISVGSGLQAVLWHTDTLKSKTNLEEHSSLITDVRFSPSMPRLATSSFDKTVRVWDADNVSGHSFLLDFLYFFLLWCIYVLFVSEFLLEHIFFIVVV